MVMTVTWY